MMKQKKLLQTKPVKLTESNTLNDILLPKKERVERAKKILESRNKL
jgi:hypothetical protein